PSSGGRRLLALKGCGVDPSCSLRLPSAACPGCRRRPGRQSPGGQGMDATRRRRTRDRARQAWYAEFRSYRFARHLGFTDPARPTPTRTTASAARDGFGSDSTTLSPAAAGACCPARLDPTVPFRLLAETFA